MRTVPAALSLAGVCSAVSPPTVIASPTLTRGGKLSWSLEFKRPDAADVHLAPQVHTPTPTVVLETRLPSCLYTTYHHQMCFEKKKKNIAPGNMR